MGVPGLAPGRVRAQNRKFWGCDLPWNGGVKKKKKMRSLGVGSCSKLEILGVGCRPGTGLGGVWNVPEKLEILGLWLSRGIVRFEGWKVPKMEDFGGFGTSSSPPLPPPQIVRVCKNPEMVKFWVQLPQKWGGFGGFFYSPPPSPRKLWGFGVPVKIWAGGRFWGPSSAGQEGFGVPLWGTRFGGGLLLQIMRFFWVPHPQNEKVWEKEFPHPKLRLGEPPFR